MLRVVSASAVAVAGFLLPVSGPAPAAAAADCVVTIAGDIAGNPDPNHEEFINASRTGDIVRFVNPTFALTAGDNAYSDGTLAEFQTQYDPTWGSFKAITLPAPGNHDYHVPNAQGYYDYFFGGVRSGNEFYATDCGGWRLYSLNCEIPCGEGSAQLAWLRSDLQAHPGGHYMGYLHRPRFTSGSNHSPDPGVAPLYQALQQAGGDVLVSGHNHQYERFGKQDANGNADPAGLRQFVAGSGGVGMYDFGPPRPNSQFRDAEHFGVLKLVLSDASYSWQFISSGRRSVSGNGVDDPDHPLGTVLDSGTEVTNIGSSGNAPPTVSAGPDASVTLPGTASLDGTVSDDGLPNPPAALTTTWSMVSGPAAVTFGDPSAVDTTASFTQPGTYVLRLTANDSALTQLDDITVTVTAAGGGGTQTLETRVAAGSDDAEQAVGGSTSLNSSDLELTTDGTTAQVVGTRFAGVQVPAGATITNAYVQFRVDETSPGASSIRIRIENSDSAPTYTTGPASLTNRAVTGAVTWSPPAWSTVGAAGPDQRTPNIASLLQQVINRTGWNQGNALALQFDGTGRRTAEASESGATLAPLLHIEYTTG